MNTPHQATPRKLMDDGVRSCVTYLLRINRMVKEETGEDLLMTSPQALAKLVQVASNEFGYGYIGQKLDGIVDAIYALSDKSSIDSNDIATLCHQLHKCSGDTLEGHTRIAEEIERFVSEYVRSNDV